MIHRVKMNDRSTDCNALQELKDGKVHRCSQRSTYYISGRSQTVKLCKYHAMETAKELVRDIYRIELDSLLEPITKEFKI